MPHPILSLFKKIPINLTQTGLEKDWLKHPQYPSLSSLSDALSLWKVPNLSAKINVNQLGDIPYPAIAHCEQNGYRYFVLLKKQHDNQVFYYDTNKGELQESIEDFSKNWHGVILLLSPNDESGELDYLKNKRYEVLSSLEKAIVTFTVGLCVLLGIWSNWQNAIPLFFAVMGTIASVAILLNEFGIAKEWIHQLCTVGKQANCNAVTQSSAGKLFNWLSWAEIGFIFFVGTGLTLLTNNSGNVLLLLICTLALPYVIFSLYYQAFIVKQWCPLCLVAMGSLVGLFLSVYFVCDYQIPSLSAIKSITIGFGIPIIAWFLLKPFWKKARLLDSTERTLQSFSRSTELAKSYLEQQESIKIFQLPNEIVLGNPNASIIITLVSNPYCSPCQEAHKLLSDLVEFYEDEIQLVIRFIGNSKDQQQVIKHILALSDSSKIVNVLHDWYSLRDYELWALKYPIEKPAEIDVAYESQTEWAEKVGINYTPTVFVNGKEWKPPFNLTDLRFHIRDIVERATVV